MYEVRIVDENARLLAALPHRGPYQEIGAVFARLGAVLQSSGLAEDVTGIVAVYHDDPAVVAEADLTSHAGAVLRPGAHVPAGFEAVELSEGRYATCLLRGPYSGLAEAWAWFAQTWLPKSGESAAPLSWFEVYLNDPASTAPEALETLLYIPLEEEDFNGPV